ncbi:hypothetical protein OOK58_42910 [Streptomyces sp. NBC_01728]|uniref:hypothetical protein n=1 Tax=unclassified Streptomyces TaxID=2593676 RepID=UPI002251C255|nr:MULTISPECIES: hypothetical protein [unclassified Streptomyces]MCX4458663.1 hypothetical protein [Streptomyces sp. NBC_01719]MCX4498020.1 hypothetical protein [Streptomyces sp. NBC_01728]
MCDATDEPTSEDPPKLHVAPPGHSRAGHRAFGWCSRCPGREVWEELLAWRQRDNEAVDESAAPDRVTHPSGEGEETSVHG